MTTPNIKLIKHWDLINKSASIFISLMKTVIISDKMEIKSFWKIPKASPNKFSNVIHVCCHRDATWVNSYNGMPTN